MANTNPLKVTVVGYGVVGSAYTKLFQSLGHQVKIYDPAKGYGKPPVGYAEGWGDINIDSDAYLICVPSSEVHNVLDSVFMRKAIQQDATLIIKSTVPPDFFDHEGFIGGYVTCVNPEFLRDKNAEEDVFNPSAIIFGCKDEDLLHVNILAHNLYYPFHGKLHFTDIKTALMVKWTRNLWLMSQVSFWNWIGGICGKTSVNQVELSELACLDPRISRYGINPRGAYGGKCFPENETEFLNYCHRNKLNPSFLEMVKKINDRVKIRGY